MSTVKISTSVVYMQPIIHVKCVWLHTLFLKWNFILFSVFKHFVCIMRVWEWCSRWVTQCRWEPVCIGDAWTQQVAVFTFPSADAVVESTPWRFKQQICSNKAIACDISLPQVDLQWFTYKSSNYSTRNTQKTKIKF